MIEHNYKLVFETESGERKIRKIRSTEGYIRGDIERIGMEMEERYNLNVICVECVMLPEE